MKLFRDIKKWFDNQEHLFYLFLVILIVPNVVLCFTEPISWTAKICNILLPLSIYYAVMAWSRNCGRTFWLLFPFIFFGAFQLVLLYLFGQSIIAVDMFLNLVTTNSSEALELLDNLIPAIVIVVVLYIPALILATISIVHKRRLSEAFIRQARRRTLYVLSAGILSLGTAYLTDNRYEPKSELYPANVCYNIALAFQRTAQTRNYHKTSKDFTFHARSTHQADERGCLRSHSSLVLFQRLWLQSQYWGCAFIVCSNSRVNKSVNSKSGTCRGVSHNGLSRQW